MNGSKVEAYELRRTQLYSMQKISFNKYSK